MDSKKPWYKRKEFLLSFGILGTLLIGSTFSRPTEAPVQTSGALGTKIHFVSQTVRVSTVESATIPHTAVNEQKSSVQQAETTRLSNDNYYTNVDGGAVHSPAYSDDNAIPAGVSARCGDGTYSFSRNHRGTCSHHGGVSRWY